MADVRFDIEPPRHGWANVRLAAPSMSLEFDASYTPRDSITELACAISALLAGEPTSNVTWNTEPEEFDFNFMTSGNDVRLEIAKFPGHSRSVRRRGTPLVVIDSELISFAQAIWRGLRRLEGKVPHEDFALAWRHPFPAAIVNRIGAELRAKREKLRHAEREVRAEPRREVFD